MAFVSSSVERVLGLRALLAYKVLRSRMPGREDFPVGGTKLDDFI